MNKSAFVASDFRRKFNTRRGLPAEAGSHAVKFTGSEAAPTAWPRITVAAALMLAACSAPAGAPPFGFTRDHAAAQRTLEKRFLDLPDAASIRDTHRELTRLPHPAGSSRDRELADWTAARFRAAGLDDVRITTHEVMLPQPLEITVEMIGPGAWRASLREEPAAGDDDTHADAAAVGLPYHAYSASGEVRAPVVYVGSGEAADYEWLAGRRIDVRGRIVLVRERDRGSYSYRGLKVLTAQQRGAAGILMFRDRERPGAERVPAYPEGPAAPPSRIERGGIAYDFVVPGDPLTPGWASLPGARRVPRSEAPSLPAIISVPLSALDGRTILQSLEGPIAPDWWDAGPQQRVGPGPAPLRLNVRMDDRTRPVWTVTGLVRGAESPDEVVIVGNHRDAWIYGGVDPSSGSAAVLELARAFGVLMREGWRPKRSVLFASWDAEEFALISSTEWGEQHQDWARDRVIAYLNVDSAASGARFVAGATPSLMRLVAESAAAVRDPSAGVSVAAIARGRAAIERGRQSTGRDDEVVEDRLGGGSDYAVFLNFLGIPVVDLAFDGAYGVSHSIYDTHAFVSRIADPGFRYHAALAKVLGIATLRLMEADAIPLDPVASVQRISTYLREIDARVGGGAGAAQIGAVRTALGELERSASTFAASRDLALARGDWPQLREINRRIVGLERTLTDERGLSGRPWYRHLIHAPGPDYGPIVLPGLAGAVDEADIGRVAGEAARLAAAFRRAAARLDGR